MSMVQSMINQKNFNQKISFIFRTISIILYNKYERNHICLGRINHRNNHNKKIKKTIVLGCFSNFDVNGSGVVLIVYYIMY